MSTTPTPIRRAADPAPGADGVPDFTHVSGRFLFNHGAVFGTVFEVMERECKRHTHAGTDTRRAIAARFEKLEGEVKAAMLEPVKTAFPTNITLEDPTASDLCKQTCHQIWVRALSSDMFKGEVPARTTETMGQYRALRAIFKAWRDSVGSCLLYTSPSPRDRG